MRREERLGAEGCHPDGGEVACDGQRHADDGALARAAANTHECNKYNKYNTYNTHNTYNTIINALRMIGRPVRRLDAACDREAAASASSSRTLYL